MYSDRTGEREDPRPYRDRSGCFERDSPRDGVARKIHHDAVVPLVLVQSRATDRPIASIGGMASFSCTDRKEHPLIRRAREIRSEYAPRSWKNAERR